MIVIVMGVSGSGKSTVGSLLADRLGAVFLDADDFHSENNKAKMSRGEPLTDADRSDWLDKLAAVIAKKQAKGISTVLACSALKRSYRTVLRIDSSVRFIYLKGSYEQILERINGRIGHFMKADMLKSQFEILEEPDDIVVGIDRSAEAIVEELSALLQR